ncbi:hypothetical protein [Bacillus cereus group sp. TH152-1LC]|uniref:hypothetical protein n=1 Tax=Bacillus cereus group sp. TH152-1LC TaxID=3018060 RepID=UPI0022E9250F|nr:hypothetical protein [Bacillus cereus group sp. TH152-1LC]MDA1675349.1 hypothetical protein [Bacillus cereus group sp. TH152-1LC]
MEKLIALSQEVKYEYIRLIKEDIQYWARENQFSVESVVFDIEYPDYEIGESDFTMKNILVDINGTVVGCKYIFDEGEKYLLWKKWSDVLDSLKSYLCKKTSEYESKSGFYNLLSFLENEKIEL